MTLVASLCSFDHTIMIGDALVSGNPAPGLDVQLPTLAYGSNRANDAINNGKGPRGLLQKLAILADDFVIGYCGNDLAALRADVKRLKERHSARPFHKGTEILEFLGKPNPSNTIIGVLSVAKGGHQFTWGNGDKIPTTEYGTVRMAGTGVKQFYSALRSETNFQQHEGESDTTPTTLTVAKLLFLTGRLLSEEIIDLRTLREQFGGAYEIAVLDGGSFKKLDDVAYFFWEAYVKDNAIAVGRYPSCGCRNCYYKDILIVQSFEQHDDHILSACFTVPPIYRAITDEEELYLKTNRQTLNSRFIVNIFAISSSAQSTAFLVTVNQQGTKPVVEFQEQNGRISIVVDQSFYDLVKNQIAAEFSTVHKGLDQLPEVHFTNTTLSEMAAIMLAKDAKSQGN